MSELTPVLEDRAAVRRAPEPTEATGARSATLTTLDLDVSAALTARDREAAERAWLGQELGDGNEALRR